MLDIIVYFKNLLCLSKVEKVYKEINMNNDINNGKLMTFLTFNVLKIICSIPMEDFSLNFEVFILITTCLVLCLKIKTFVVWV